MVRLYLNQKDPEGNEQWFDVNYWSIVKAHFLGALGVYMIAMMIAIIFALMINLFDLI